MITSSTYNPLSSTHVHPILIVTLATYNPLSSTHIHPVLVSLQQPVIHCFLHPCLSHPTVTSSSYNPLSISSNHPIATSATHHPLPIYSIHVYSTLLSHHLFITHCVLTPSMSTPSLLSPHVSLPHCLFTPTMSTPPRCHFIYPSPTACLLHPCLPLSLIHI